MRRLLLVAVLAALAWWVLRRRDAAKLERAHVGYEDGSALVFDVGTPDRDSLVALAREVLDG